MKNTGIVRNMDHLGRIVVPMEIRKTFGWNENTPIEIHTDEEEVVLREYKIKCTFCGAKETLTEYKGKKICLSCLLELKGDK